ncbi:MAG: hypothetical protein NTW29_04385 [Bacteroidetes bacterium]|nr:hypothetical protein [Bacteroidota bacterium]
MSFLHISKYIYKYIMAGVFFFFFVACHDAKPTREITTVLTGLHPEKLGATGYVMNIPYNMYVEEARGKEGQLGYDILSNDSIYQLQKPYVFIEVESGRPIGGRQHADDGKLTGYIQSIVFGKKNKWSLRLSETKYYTAYATRNGLSFYAESLTTEGIDSMITIVGTLTKE